MNAEKLSSIGVEPKEIGKIEGAPAYQIKLRSVEQTAEIIRQFILESSKDVRLRLLVSKIIAPCKSKNFLCYLLRIVNYVKRNIKYVNDPPRLETLQSPERTLSLRMGDCDDHTILTGTLLRLAGFPIRIVLGDINSDGRYEHVYLKARLPDGRWLTVDTTSSRPLSPKAYPEKEIFLNENENGALGGEMRPLIKSCSPWKVVKKELIKKEPPPTKKIVQTRTRIVKAPLYRRPDSPIGVWKITEQRTCTVYGR